MGKFSMKTKYIPKYQINYTEEDKIINQPLSCTKLKCHEYQTDKDGTIVTIMVYAGHRIQIPLVMMLNLMITHYISKYAPVLRSII